MTAADVAGVLQIAVDSVYQSPELQRVARRLGDGPRPRLRWTIADLERAFPCEDVRVDTSGNAVSASDSGGQPPETPIRRRRRRPA